MNLAEVFGEPFAWTWLLPVHAKNYLDIERERKEKDQAKGPVSGEKSVEDNGFSSKGEGGGGAQSLRKSVGVHSKSYSYSGKEYRAANKGATRQETIDEQEAAIGRLLEEKARLEAMELDGSTGGESEEDEEDEGDSVDGTDVEDEDGEGGTSVENAKGTGGEGRHSSGDCDFNVMSNDELKTREAGLRQRINKRESAVPEALRPGEW
jgi:hypothetical protein